MRSDSEGYTVYRDEGAADLAEELARLQRERQEAASALEERGIPLGTKVEQDRYAVRHDGPNRRERRRAAKLMRNGGR